ncbi:Nucleolar transcription factor 1 Upstream-binding factor 1 [Channa argus]|uniref:Nucleolar transcription factor 1 Upstream-binding factor 1 n=1 Tax=Channa argus TaxID=215402 RepID=A0A6G1QCL0_CHAAH|nr:Nucleolar transcription factor 1 Upstream-binding factor 1 [Channa argus]
MEKEKLLRLWAQDDLLKLLEGMKVALPQKDLTKYKTSESHLDWQKVAFNTYTAEMCKQKWQEVSKEIRKFRTLTELIIDAQDYIKNPYKGKKIKKHPDFPKKPLTPYFRFFMEKRAKYAKLHPEMSNLDLTKILSKKYRELPDKKKKKYVDDFLRDKESFVHSMMKFREEHPDLVESMTKKGSNVPEKPKTPQQLWYNHEKKAFLKTRPDATTKDIKEGLGKQWTQLPDKKRLKWITKSLEQKKQYEETMREYIQQHPELNMTQDDIVKSTLTKAERHLKDKSDGRPDKPPPNGYSMFCAELMSSMKDVPSTERMVMCSQRWKLLKQIEKDAYQKRCEQRKKEYEIEMNRFLSSLSEEEQQRVLGEEKVGFRKGTGASSPASKKKNSKTKANPEKPKRPISAMFIFSEEKRPKLQQERPDLSDSELTRLLARMWNELPDKKKEKYKRLETVLKAESEKKEKDRSRLPDPPKTAQDIWQQSVIGDYLARFKNDRPKAQKAMEATWSTMEKKEKIMLSKSAAEDKENKSEESSSFTEPKNIVWSKGVMTEAFKKKKRLSSEYPRFSSEMLTLKKVTHFLLKVELTICFSVYFKITGKQDYRSKKVIQTKGDEYLLLLQHWHQSLRCQTSACGAQFHSKSDRCVKKPAKTTSKTLLPDADAVVENDSFDIPDGQTLMSRLQWEDSPDISPTDSASSKASTNHSDLRKPKKKKRTSLGFTSGAGGGGGGGGAGVVGVVGSLTGSSSSQMVVHSKV